MLKSLPAGSLRHLLLRLLLRLLSEIVFSNNNESQPVSKLETKGKEIEEARPHTFSLRFILQRRENALACSRSLFSSSLSLLSLSPFAPSAPSSASLSSSSSDEMYCKPNDQNVETWSPETKKG